MARRPAPKRKPVRRRRRNTLTRKLVRRAVVKPLKARRAAKKRQQAAAAKAWTTIPRSQRGTKIPRAKGGGRLVKPGDLVGAEAWEAARKHAREAERKGLTPAALAAQKREVAAKAAERKARTEASAARKLAAAKAKAGTVHGTGIPHGENRGYHAHLAHGSPACPACLEAHAAYNRAHR
jgi:hypothetical protein